MTLLQRLRPTRKSTRRRRFFLPAILKEFQIFPDKTTKITTVRITANSGTTIRIRNDWKSKQIDQ
jgi:hypothetical protein